MDNKSLSDQIETAPPDELELTICPFTGTHMCDCPNVPRWLVRLAVWLAEGERRAQNRRRGWWGL